jgi:sulfite exporter TauE/SafE
MPALSTATESGIRNLPIIAGAGILSVGAEFLLSFFGNWVPLLVLGALIATGGCAMIYTFQVDTASPIWIGAQAMAGIGFGTAFQLPINGTRPSCSRRTSLACRPSPSSSKSWEQRFLCLRDKQPSATGCWQASPPKG